MADAHQPIWIKFCGTTNLEDAQASIDAGCNALGFILCDSPRRLSPDAVGKITSQLPEPIEKIGVFVNEELNALVAIAEECGLTGVQLQGDESANYLMDVRSKLSVLRITKTLHADHVGEADIFCASCHFALDNLLIDNGTYQQRGGTGKVFDWTVASETLRGFKLPIAVVIAGGLNPGNVGDAVKLFRPYGVDVCSGVESAQGKKDPVKLKAYVAAVRKAEAEIAST